MRKRTALAVVVGIAAGFIAYASAFVLCIGVDPGTQIAAVCSDFSFLLKGVFLPLVPSIRSKLLGFDSAMLMLFLNGVFYGGITGLIVRLCQKRN
ncbi:MAG TPA: hypothetical protein PK586_07800 [Casimicrobium sp.]|nr:hypothetical protein [Casimicrobium sp.]